MRSQFGAKLSRARVSAAALIVGLVGYEWYAFAEPGPILGGRTALAIVQSHWRSLRDCRGRDRSRSAGPRGFGLVAAFFHASSPVIATLALRGESSRSSHRGAAAS